jgi:L-fucose mutarotase
MLKVPLLQPDILRALAAAGHGSRILIADGNYPLSTASPANATRVYLNLRPGCVSVMDVLAALIPMIPVEAALVMLPRDGHTPQVHREIHSQLGREVPLHTKAREEFYVAARHPDTALAIATGEQRRFANVLLTIGTVRMGSDTDALAAASLPEGSFARA